MIGALAYRDGRVQPTSFAWAALLMWLSLLLVIAYVVWCLFERHTQLVRKAMQRIVGRMLTAP